MNPDNRFIHAAAEAMSEVFGKPTVYIRSGGSIPIVAAFEQSLGIPSVMMGFGLPDDNLHAPNEKLHLPNFYRGIEAVARYLDLLGVRSPARHASALTPSPASEARHQCYNPKELEGANVKFFLDTANLDELKKGANWGIVDGVTTNPTLIAKEGRPLEDQIRLICDIVDGDISAEVVSTEAEPDGPRRAASWPACTRTWS